MAKTDRNSEYMAETFGTKYLITDYGVDIPAETPKQKAKKLYEHLTKIIDERSLNEIFSDYKNSVEDYKSTHSHYTEENISELLEMATDYGFSMGRRSLAQAVVEILKTIQK